MNQAQQTLESMSQAVWYNRWTVEKFKRYLQGDILEVGCGIGSFTQTLTKYGNVFAIDINKSHIERTSELLNGKAKVGFGDIELGEYFFPQMSFDTVLCLNVLEHIRNDSQALSNLARLLNPDGMLILLVPAHTFLYTDIDCAIGHVRRYDKKNLEYRLKEIGLEMVMNREINFLGAVGWWLAGKVLRNKAVSANKIALFNIVGPLFLLMENVLEPPLGTSILAIARKRTTARKAG